MNKEFKKLLEQSYTKGFEECARTGHKVGDIDAIFNSIVMGEFAELIVRECVAICKDIDGEDNIDARSGRQDCAVEIREHFGVE